MLIKPVIPILHNIVPPDAPADEQDVLVQVEAVSRALAALGYEPRPLSVSLATIKGVVDVVVEVRARFAFNLVESLDGRESLIGLVPLALDGFGIPYTGVQAGSLLLTTNKLRAKKLMRLAGMPTAPWDVALRVAESGTIDFDPPYIVKSYADHGSLALEGSSVFSTREDVVAHVRGVAAGTVGLLMVERYVDGREFNVSVLQGPREPQILPLAEIRFDSWDARAPRIVGYRAKWDASSWEYHHTPRHFDFSSDDASLLRHLRELSAECWNLFDLTGYARVDFRVDNEGRPWILEVNANPCVSPDAGLAAAAARVGIDYTALVARIADCAQMLR